MTNNNTASDLTIEEVRRIMREILREDFERTFLLPFRDEAMYSRYVLGNSWTRVTFPGVLV